MARRRNSNADDQVERAEDMFRLFNPSIYPVIWSSDSHIIGGSERLLITRSRSEDPVLQSLLQHKRLILTPVRARPMPVAEESGGESDPSEHDQVS